VRHYECGNCGAKSKEMNFARCPQCKASCEETRAVLGVA